MLGNNIKGLNHPLELLKIVRKTWPCMKVDDVLELLTQARAYQDMAVEVNAGHSIHIFKQVLHSMTKEDRVEYESLLDVDLGEPDDI